MQSRSYSELMCCISVPSPLHGAPLEKHMHACWDMSNVVRYYAYTLEQPLANNSVIVLSCIILVVSYV